MTIQRFFLLVVALLSMCATGAFFALGREGTADVLCWIDGLALLGAILPASVDDFLI